MLGRAIQATALSAAAALLGGCMAMAPEGSFRPGMLAPRQASRPEAKALDEAVADVGNLEYERASGKLAGLATRFAEAGDRYRAAKALFWLSYCYEKTGRKNQAEVFYQQVIRKYPNTPAAEQSRGRLARLGIKRPARDESGP